MALTEPIIIAPGTIPPAGYASIEAEPGMTITYGPGAGTVYLGPQPIITVASAFDDALASLTLIEGLYEGIEILSALPNEEYDPSGALADTVQISYAIVGRPGVFTVSVPYANNWTAIAFFRIGEDAQNVELIYEGASDNQQVPTQLLVPTSSGPPTLIPQPGTATPV